MSKDFIAYAQRGMTPSQFLGRRTEPRTARKRAVTRALVRTDAREPKPLNHVRREYRDDATR
ncbi:MAG: hypothetical protein JWO86_1432 [Myxococcaceae bacterium]|nr:hypothetical protein [Myxococcaceae bacterium]